MTQQNLQLLSLMNERILLQLQGENEDKKKIINKNERTALTWQFWSSYLSLLGACSWYGIMISKNNWCRESPVVKMDNTSQSRLTCDFALPCMFGVVVFLVTMTTASQQRESVYWTDVSESAVDCSLSSEHTAHTRSLSDRGGEVCADRSSLFNPNQSDRTGSLPLIPSRPAEETPTWSSSSADSCCFTAFNSHTCGEAYCCHTIKKKKKKKICNFFVIIVNQFIILDQAL